MNSSQALVPLQDPQWEPILHASTQVVLYNPTSHALTIRHSSPRRSSEAPRHCPYCSQPIPPGFVSNGEIARNTHDSIYADSDAYNIGDAEDAEDERFELHGRASNYFQLLAIANETTSRPSTPLPFHEEGGDDEQGRRERRSSNFPAEAMAEGYFKAFFREECKLGMGANGSVFLCQHVLDGNSLGHFAVKKIAVGQSHTYLLKILREVRLLESLHHPNIVTYHHAWLETSQFSAFGPKVPTLHVLMQWAEGGSLDGFIDHRLGRFSWHSQLLHPSTPPATAPASTSTTSSPLHRPTNPLSRSARIRAFREFQRAAPSEREQLRQAGTFDSEGGAGAPSWKAVHLLSAEEVKGMFGNVVDGLAFLHDKSILHLDLKPGNVLLTWDQGKLIPRAMLSDFGTSQDMLHSSRVRSGNTGTLEYTSPESLPSPHTGLLQQVDSKADMWSLGMVLHKLLFFRLPYQYASDGEGNESGEMVGEEGEEGKMKRLEREVLGYPGFKSTPHLVKAFEARRLPRAFLVLLETLLNVTPSSRPSCERVCSAIREGRLDPIQPASGHASSDAEHGTLSVHISRRASPGMEYAHGIEREHTRQHDREVDEDHIVGTDIREETKTEGSNNGDKRMPLPLLGLPAPPERENGTSWAKVRAFFGRHSSGVGMRTFKSCVLIGKVLTVREIRHTNPVLLSVMLVIAVADTWSDELWVSGILGVIHLGALWAGYAGL